MKVVVYGLGNGLANTIYRLKVDKARLCNALRRAKAVEEGALALGADTGNFV